ncbi:MAG: CopG family transcriptional regulator [Methylotenera sp.]|nr:CopG family transcriptional regulator [Methylotenera sp.]
MTATLVKPVAIKLDQNTRERLKRLGEARDRSPHWLMLEAVKSYVDREERREAFRQDAINAWEQYQKDGLHVTGDDVNNWLDQLANGIDAEPPVCHK